MITHLSEKGMCIHTQLMKICQSLWRMSQNVSPFPGMMHFIETKESLCWHRTLSLGTEKSTQRTGGGTVSVQVNVCPGTLVWAMLVASSSPWGQKPALYELVFHLERSILFWKGREVYCFFSDTCCPSDSGSYILRWGRGSMAAYTL